MFYAYRNNHNLFHGVLMRYILVLTAGLLFGFGLAWAGMLNPQKIQGFLHITGAWDPSLAFVIAGGMIINMLGYQLYNKNHPPLFAARKSLPKVKLVDTQLIVGSGLFGVGWALTGLCPGPFVANLGVIPSTILPLLGILMLGLVLGNVVRKVLKTPSY